jgi:hypothetical protein
MGMIQVGVDLKVDAHEQNPQVSGQNLQFV